MPAAARITVSAAAFANGPAADHLAAGGATDKRSTALGTGAPITSQ